MGIDILGIDIMGVDILGIDIPAPTHFINRARESCTHTRARARYEICRSLKLVCYPFYLPTKYIRDQNVMNYRHLH